MTDRTRVVAVEILTELWIYFDDRDNRFPDGLDEGVKEESQG